MLKATAAAVVVGLATTASGLADDQSAKSFVGLWQGVDNVDGSLRTISITELDDGTFNVLAHDSYWTMCEGPGGLETDTGQVDDKGVLQLTGQVNCRSGATVEFDTRYTWEDGTLHEEVVDAPFRTIYFRINQ
ncbi:hypothetical protein [Bauldia sp.]|uniref:hypothetical protein n=1 Tax=Bauldia sp. TaxID=2575872 RepID=UPI003BAD073D